MTRNAGSATEPVDEQLERIAASGRALREALTAAGLVSSAAEVLHSVRPAVVRHEDLRSACPVCLANIMREAITRLVYTNEICECNAETYRHLIERVWHRECFLRLGGELPEEESA